MKKARRIKAGVLAFTAVVSVAFSSGITDNNISAGICS